MYSETNATNITCLKWRDKRDVTLISTLPDNGMINVTRRTRGNNQGTETIRKPGLIDVYNKYMGGVDISDQLVKYYGYPHRL